MQNCWAHTSSCLLLTVLSLCVLHKQPLLFGVAVHSYATHKYLLKDWEWRFQAWCINLIWVLRLAILCAMCHFLHSHVYDAWNEENGSENERITIKLQPKSADHLMSIRGFKPSKKNQNMSALYFSVLSYLLPATWDTLRSYRGMCVYWWGRKAGRLLWKLPVIKLMTIAFCHPDQMLAALSMQKYPENQ